MQTPSHCWPSMQLLPASLVGQMQLSTSPMPWMSQSPWQASHASLVTAFDFDGWVSEVADLVSRGLEPQAAAERARAMKVKAKCGRLGDLLMAMWGGVAADEFGVNGILSHRRIPSLRIALWTKQWGGLSIRFSSDSLAWVR